MSRVRYMAICRASVTLRGRPGPTMSSKVRWEVFGDARDDVGGLHLHVGGEEILQCAFGERTRDGLVVERGHRDDPLECALEFSHVVGEAFGDEIEHVVRHANVVLLGEHAQNRDARLQIRRLDVHGDALLEAGR